MTAESELFVNETIRDIVSNTLKKEVEIEVPEEWKDIWSPNEYPEDGIADIYENNIKIGTVSWDTHFFIENDIGTGKFIDAEAEKITIELTSGKIIKVEETWEK